MHIDPRFGRRLFQGADLAASGVDLDLLEADHAVQGRFVGLFHAVLADVAGPGVVRDIDLLQIPLTDAANVTQHVGGLHVVRVMAKQLCLDVDAGETVAVNGELGGFILAQIDPDRDAVETALALSQLPEALEVFLVDLDHLAQFRDGGIEIVDLLRGNLEAVGRAVLCQQHPLAVVDEPTCRRQRQHLYPVFARQRGEVLMIDDLKLYHAPGKRKHRGHHQQAGDDGAGQEGLAFADGVLDLHALNGLCVAGSDDWTEIRSRFTPDSWTPLPVSWFIRGQTRFPQMTLKWRRILRSVTKIQGQSSAPISGTVQ